MTLPAVLARRQPVASDLRFVTMALKVVTDLERMGDLGVNICERVMELNEEPPLKPYVEVVNMAEAAQKCLREALDAFVAGDAERAQAIVERDSKVDAYYTAIFRELLTYMMENPRNIFRATRVQSIASTSNASPIMQRTSPKWSSSWCVAKTFVNVGKLERRTASKPPTQRLGGCRLEGRRLGRLASATSSVNEAGLQRVVESLSRLSRSAQAGGSPSHGSSLAALCCAGARGARRNSPQIVVNLRSCFATPPGRILAILHCHLRVFCSCRGMSSNGSQECRGMVNMSALSSLPASTVLIRGSSPSCSSASCSPHRHAHAAHRMQRLTGHEDSGSHADNRPSHHQTTKSPTTTTTTERAHRKDSTRGSTEGRRFDASSGRRRKCDPNAPVDPTPPDPQNTDGSGTDGNGGDGSNSGTGSHHH